MPIEIMKPIYASSSSTVTAVHFANFSPPMHSRAYSNISDSDEEPAESDGSHTHTDDEDTSTHTTSPVLGKNDRYRHIPITTST